MPQSVFENDFTRKFKKSLLSKKVVREMVEESIILFHKFLLRIILSKKANVSIIICFDCVVLFEY